MIMKRFISLIFHTSWIFLLKHFNYDGACDEGTESGGDTAFYWFEQVRHDWNGATYLLGFF